MPYDALLTIKRGEKTYRYEFVEKESTDELTILNGIRSFVKNYASVTESLNYYALESEVPVMTRNNVPTTFIDCVVEKEYVMRFDDKGYIVYYIAISRYVVDEISIVYIVTVSNAFVPGIVAMQNDETGFGSYKNQKGYVHMTVEQAFDANEEYFYGRRYGCTPYKKDYWPLNNSNVVTITSSLQVGGNIGQGRTLGFSFENGFSLDGASISYSYTKSITRPEPAWSAQVNSADLRKCEWNYEYAENTPETYYLTTNYMFEMSNSRNEMFIGDFRLKLDYKFVVDKGFLWTAQTNRGSADLFVRAGEYEAIYNFCSGMI